MKFLHLADLHLASKISASWGKNLQEQADYAVWRALTALFDEAEDMQVDLVLLAGDILEANELTQWDIDRFIALLKKRRTFTVLAVAGNHDPLTTFSPWEQIKAASIPNFYLFGSEAVEAVYFPKSATVVYGYSFPAIYQRESILPARESCKTLYMAVDGIFERAEFDRYEHELQDAFPMALVHASPEPAYLPVDKEAYLYNPLQLKDLEAATVAYAALGHFHSPCCNFLLQAGLFTPAAKSNIESDAIVASAAANTGVDGAVAASKAFVHTSEAHTATKPGAALFAPQVQLHYTWRPEQGLTLTTEFSSSASAATFVRGAAFAGGERFATAELPVTKGSSKDGGTTALAAEAKFKQSWLLPRQGTIAAWPGSFQARNFGEAGVRGHYCGELTKDGNFILTWRTQPTALFRQADIDIGNINAFADLEKSVDKLVSGTADCSDAAAINGASKFGGDTTGEDTTGSDTVGGGSGSSGDVKCFWRITLQGEHHFGSTAEIASWAALYALKNTNVKIIDNSKASLNWEELIAENELAQRLYKISTAYKWPERTDANAMQEALNSAWQAISDSR